MIIQTGHYDRYSRLMDQVSTGGSGRRQKDGEYAAALYVLAADTDLCMLAINYVGTDGIDFEKIVSAGKKHGLQETQMTAIKAAWNLFNRGGGKKTGAADLAQCDYDTLDVLVQALYIKKGGRWPECGEDGCIVLDTCEEKKKRVFAREFRVALEEG